MRENKRTIVLFTLLIIVAAVAFYRYESITDSAKEILSKGRYVESPYPKTTFSDGSNTELTSTNNNKLSETNIDNIFSYKEFFMDKYMWNQDMKKEKLCDSSSIGSWEEREAKRHVNVLNNAQYDIIVLPVQERDWENDRVSRLMSARLLAHEIEIQTGKKVMSPELAMRVLGSSQVIFDPIKVNDLAKKVKAEVVYLFKERLNDKDIKITLLLTDYQGKIKNKVHFAFSQETYISKRNKLPSKQIKDLPEVIYTEPLEIIVKSNLSEMIGGLFKLDHHATVKILDAGNDNWNLTDRIDELPGKIHSPLGHAAYLQFLALLTPKILDFERRRLFERSLIALENVNPNSKYFNLIQSRALFHLYRRPFALKFISEINTPEEKALINYINGNLTAMQNEIKNIKIPLFHILSFIELNDLRYSYNKGRQDQESFMVPNDRWMSIVNAASHDGDRWYHPNNIEFFYSIKGLYPEFDNMLDERLKGESIINDNDYLNNNETIFSDIFNLLGDNFSEPELPKYADKIEKGDIWNLYRNISISNMLRNIIISVDIHGSYQTAIDKAERLGTIFNGQPLFMYYYGAALNSLAKRQKGTERKINLEKSFDLIMNVFSNSCESYEYTGNLEPISLDIGNSLSRGGNVRAIVKGGYPSKNVILQNAYTNLPFTNSNFLCFEDAEKDSVLNVEGVEKVISTRFDGHPRKTLYLASKFFDKDEDEQGMRILRDAIENGDAGWDTYNMLATKLVDKGQYDEAKSIWLKFPSFQKTPEDRVATSNYARRAGAVLYDLGRHEEAKPFLEIAGSLDTGASSQYYALQRLSILSGDYENLLSYAYIDGNRYNNLNSYNLLFSFLHILGQHDYSESGFKQLINREGSEILWISQFIGNRIQQQTQLKDNLEWIRINGGFEDKDIPALHYIFSEIITDRFLEKNQFDIAMKFEIDSNSKHPEHYEIDKNPYDYFAQFNTYLYKRYKDLFNNLDSHKTNEEYLFFSNFVNAYDLFMHSNYQDCLNKILEYVVNQSSSASKLQLYTLPYFAISSSRILSDDKLHDFDIIIDEILENKQLSPSGQKMYFPPSRYYDCYLSKAVLKAHFGQHEDAIHYLNEAISVAPINSFADNRAIFTSYQLLQTMEWLSREYGNEQYLDKALDYAKRHQKTEPQYSWFYSFVALYGQDQNDRVSGAAFAQYIDSHSYWLSLVPDDLKNEGRKWWKKNNPFVLQDSEKKFKEDA